MPSKMALVDYKKCHPEKCDSGICAAALAYSHGLLRQKTPCEISMTDPFFAGVAVIASVLVHLRQSL